MNTSFCADDTHAWQRMRSACLPARINHVPNSRGHDPATPRTSPYLYVYRTWEELCLHRCWQMNGMNVMLHFLEVNSSSDARPVDPRHWRTLKQRHSCVGTPPQCKPTQELLQL